MRKEKIHRKKESWFSKKAVSGRYKVNVRFGKPVDIVSLKTDIINNFSSHVSDIRTTRLSLFKSRGLETVNRCPVCASSTTNSRFLIDIYGGRYHKCASCGHCFLIRRPTEKALKNFYCNNTSYAFTYTSKRAAEDRMRQITLPKIDWVLNQFKSLYGKAPQSVRDVGAGAGHFVYACREKGIRSYGIELSKPCINFCRSNFGIELMALDFTREWKRFKDIDIVTFWGVIEHTPNPVSLLKAARRLLPRKKGLTVVEVPRWDSLSTRVQSLFPDSIVRHLDPLGHINFFTDDSLLTAFERSGFAPVAAWYFGMDGYEVLTQLSHACEDADIIKMLKKDINRIQSSVDRRRMSDTIVLAGRPA